MVYTIFLTSLVLCASGFPIDYNRDSTHLHGNGRAAQSAEGQYPPHKSNGRQKRSILSRFVKDMAEVIEKFRVYPILAGEGLNEADGVGGKFKTDFRNARKSANVMLKDEGDGEYIEAGENWTPGDDYLGKTYFYSNVREGKNKDEKKDGNIMKLEKEMTDVYDIYFNSVKGESHLLSTLVEKHRGNRDREYFVDFFLEGMNSPKSEKLIKEILVEKPELREKIIKEHEQFKKWREESQMRGIELTKKIADKLDREDIQRMESKLKQLKKTNDDWFKYLPSFK